LEETVINAAFLMAVRLEFCKTVIQNRPNSLKGNMKMNDRIVAEPHRTALQHLHVYYRIDIQIEKERMNRERLQFYKHCIVCRPDFQFTKLSDDEN
jgi:hypothetical protein